jgi:co-chaperonin GroES (HSP10)
LVLKPDLPSIRAFGDKVVIEPDDDNPEYGEDNLHRGKIVAVGGGYWSNGIKVKFTDLSVGDVVLYTAGLKFDFLGKQYVCVTYSNLYSGITVEGLGHESNRQ